MTNRLTAGNGAAMPGHRRPRGGTRGRTDTTLRTNLLWGKFGPQTDKRKPPPPPCVTFRRVVAPLRGPGQSPVLPFACCVGSLRSVGRCGRCSCWCRFRVRGAQWFVACVVGAVLVLGHGVVMLHVRALFVGGGGCVWVKCPCGVCPPKATALGLATAGPEALPPSPTTAAQCVWGVCWASFRSFPVVLAIAHTYTRTYTHEASLRVPTKRPSESPPTGREAPDVRSVPSCTACVFAGPRPQGPYQGFPEWRKEKSFITPTGNERSQGRSLRQRFAVGGWRRLVAVGGGWGLVGVGGWRLVVPGGRP